VKSSGRSSPKGYWLQIVNIDNDEHREVNLKNVTEALYLIIRRYQKTPRLKTIRVMLNSKVLKEYNIKDGLTLEQNAVLIDENDPTFDPLAAYREANPQKQGYTKYLDGKNKDENDREHPGPGKDFLVKRNITFTISNIYIKESNKVGFSDQIMYVIHLDTDPAYETLKDMLDLEDSYQMGLPENSDRQTQMEILNKYFVGTDKRLKLIKRGKAFDIVKA
jgi:hypothetical protein